MPTINIFKIDDDEIGNCIKKLSKNNDNPVIKNYNSKYTLKLYIYHKPK